MQTQDKKLQEIFKIKILVEHVLGHKLDYQPDTNDLLNISSPTTSQDELELIKYYIQNQHLVTEQLISDIVDEQLRTYPLAAEHINNPKQQTWDQYLQKLEQVLDGVKYRRAQNYEFNQVMPSLQQLLELQHECIDLTEQWYGVGNGNISCFYKYFVAMSQAAYVTCFEYAKIPKFTSKDKFISAVNPDVRRELYLYHEEHYYRDFVRQGGRWARGRSEIDATTISNLFYYKTAQQLFNYECAKKIVVSALQLENYGQLPFSQRKQIWHSIKTHFPDDTEQDANSIFYKFAVFLNTRPGEFFNYFGADLSEANHISQQMLFDIIKISGIKSGRLLLLTRDAVDNWAPKRYLSLHWIRKYPLQSLRKVGDHEWPRIWPNEMPYTPCHGLSLCGDGLVEGWERYGSVAYEWNTPVDPAEEEDNLPRDIEKMFRELKLLCPQIKYGSILKEETLLNVFQNTIAYSTIQGTQHLHISSGSIDNYPLYALNTAQKLYSEILKADFEFVEIGNEPDAFFLKITFGSLDNEALIQALLQLNHAMLHHFGGVEHLDAYMHLFPTQQGKFVFVYEPHIRLIQLEPNLFVNPLTEVVTPRRPQMLIPQGDDISLFSESNVFSGGREYIRKFFDATSKPGSLAFIKDFIAPYLTLHQ